MIKRLWLILLLAIPLGAQTVTYTPNLHLAQPPHGYPNWDAIINQNWSVLDQTIGPHQPWTLTTTGSCSAATYVNGVLNIPSCGGGGGAVGPGTVWATPYFDTTTSLKGQLVDVPLSAFVAGGTQPCTGSSDDTAAFQAAVDYMYDHTYSTGIGATYPTVQLSLPAGTCNLTSGSINYRGEPFHGVSPDQTYVKAGAHLDAFLAPDNADAPTRHCCLSQSTVHDVTIAIDGSSDPNTAGSLANQAAWAARGRGLLAGSIFANTFAGWSGQTVMGNTASNATTIPLTTALDLTNYHAGYARDGWVKVGSEFMRYHGLSNTSCPNSAPSCLLNVTRGVTLAGIASTAAGITGGASISPVNPLAPGNVSDWIPANTVGACAFAFPARDGNHLQDEPFQHGLIYHVKFEPYLSSQEPSKNVCAFFDQGSMYSIAMRDVYGANLTYGIVQAPPFTNTDLAYTGNSSDGMVFDHLDLQATIPFVSVLAGLSTLQNSQFYANGGAYTGGNYQEAIGATFYRMPCHTYSPCADSEQYGWNLSNVYQEWNNNGGGLTIYPPMAQIGGFSMTMTAGFMNSGPAAPTVWDGSFAQVNGTVLGAIQLNGSQNTFLTDSTNDGTNFDFGYGNKVSAVKSQYGNRPTNMQATRPFSLNNLTSDFLNRGAVSGDWFQSLDDLFYTPEDIANSAPIEGVNGSVVNDSAVPIAHRYLPIPSPGSFSGALDGNAAGAMTIGQRFPKGTGWAYVAVWSPIITTQVVRLQCASGTAGTGTITYAAGVWQIFKFRYDSTIGGCVLGANGGYFSFDATATPSNIRIGYEGIVPDYSLLTVSGILNSALSTPASSSAACVAGDWAHDTGFIYTCTATNTWKRVAIATW